MYMCEMRMSGKLKLEDSLQLVMSNILKVIETYDKLFSRTTHYGTW